MKILVTGTTRGLGKYLAEHYKCDTYNRGDEIPRQFYDTIIHCAYDHDKYPNDDACLHEVFLNRYSHLESCPSCEEKFSYHKVSDRKCYACASCGHQLHPLADTIFHKSSTALKNWFYAIFLFSTSKNGVSAKELERQFGVTYKCAYRIAKQIRKLFDENIKL